VVADPQPLENSLLELEFSELGQQLLQAGIKTFHARELWRVLYRQPHVDLLQRKDLAAPLLTWLQKKSTQARCSPLLKVQNESKSSDGLTRKWLFKLRDEETIEAVLMGYPGRFTACISTQAGCAMGCVFCATGQAGFVRHLKASEMVAQLRHIQAQLYSMGERGLRNVVLMGMGEPLHNYDAVMKALSIVTDSRGFNIGPARISISTVGVVPGILRMAEEQSPYNLAVSLHGANEKDRSRLLPVSKRWPLDELMEACRVYAEKTKRRIFFSWTLIAGENDSAAQASELSDLLDGLDAHINLIPLNPTEGFAKGASANEAVYAFQGILLARGLPCTIRQRRGIDVAAGCGQLKASSEKELA
jgi:23S rRNA (adenine2503-C2)-methyltransferase